MLARLETVLIFFRVRTFEFHSYVLIRNTFLFPRQIKLSLGNKKKTKLHYTHTIPFKMLTFCLPIQRPNPLCGPRGFVELYCSIA